MNSYSILALVLSAYYFIKFFNALTKKIAFTELILVIYSVNYLFSPAILYTYNEKLVLYKLKLTPDNYFPIAIISILALHIGMSIKKVKIFEINFNMLKLESLLNERMLKQWVIVGSILTFLQGNVYSELSFFIYLTSQIRYIGALGLTSINFKKNILYIVIPFLLEIYNSIIGAMFADTSVWSMFFVIFVFYIKKPHFIIKFTILGFSIVSLIALQISKNDYRERTWRGTEAASLSTLKQSFESSQKGENTESYFSDNKIINTLTRFNQSWILMSTIKNMDEKKDFQSYSLIILYLKSALLPRFLAPDKLNSGDKEIFNRFSGHTISSGTAMGLGILADGYISFGKVGIMIFSFVLGLIFSLIFYIVSKWALISPFFILFSLPILNYAIRPDCETQTLLGNLVKSLFVYSILVSYYKYSFNKKIVLKSSLV